MRRFRDAERGLATITDFFERRRNIEAWKDGASILGEIEVGRNLTTCQYGLNEVFLSVIVSKIDVASRPPISHRHKWMGGEGVDLLCSVEFRIAFQ